MISKGPSSQRRILAGFVFSPDVQVPPPVSTADPNHPTEETHCSPLYM